MSCTVLPIYVNYFQWKVRRTLAFSIHELAVILGDQLTAADLVPIFNGFLKDLDEVRIGILKHLYDFLKVGIVHICSVLPTSLLRKDPDLETASQQSFMLWQFPGWVIAVAEHGSALKMVWKPQFTIGNAHWDYLMQTYIHLTAAIGIRKAIAKGHSPKA